MSRVRTRYGAFAVPGNHEHWYGKVEDLQRIFRHYGMPLLLNGHRGIGGTFTPVRLNVPPEVTLFLLGKRRTPAENETSDVLNEHSPT